ncbi:hypothetical protein [Actinocorallia populi]|uniref:hypothetical protein n=1 Tax=Actinocorallia populi TaxID=2079200 RepID=UPI000D090A54|nr:hypothetical protein [Actinocorallia populi]
MLDLAARFWPFVLAAVAAVSMPTEDPSAETAALANVLLLLPLVYLMVAKAGRRKATWPVLLLLTGVYVLLRELDVVPPSVVFTGTALAVLLWGALDGELRNSRTFRIQAFGMLAFGALALTALLVEPALGRHLVAAGWFLHGFWDFAHLRKDAVVARSYAKWCGTLDILVAAQLVLLPWIVSG